MNSKKLLRAKFTAYWNILKLDWNYGSIVFSPVFKTLEDSPLGIYLVKFNSGNLRVIFETCSGKESSQ